MYLDYAVSHKLILSVPSSGKREFGRQRNFPKMTSKR